MEQCPQLESVGAYHDGELSAARRVEVEAHLSKCPSCAAELESLRSLSALFRVSPAEAPGSRVLAELHEQVDALTERSVLRFAQLLSGIAAAVLIGVGGWLMTAPAAAPQPAGGWEEAAVTLRPHNQAEPGPMRTARWMATELAMQR